MTLVVLCIYAGVLSGADEHRLLLVLVIAGLGISLGMAGSRAKAWSFPAFTREKCG